MAKTRTLILFPIFLAVPLAITSCFSVSKQDQILSSSGEIRHDDPLCAEQPVADGTQKVLSETGFTLTSWNIYKQNNTGWRKDLKALSNESDLLLLQEAYLTPELTQLLGLTEDEWEMISAFRYQGIHAGVMTAGDIPALSSCAQRIIEPLAQLPKSSLISYFPVKDRKNTLLVANIHSINFTPGVELFTEQLQEIKSVMARHQGPIVFAGDFNTWSQERLVILDQLTGDLGLKEVTFDGTEPVQFFGHHLDHIFFRGLTLENAEAVSVESSDHYPLKAHFKFVPKGSY